MKKNKLIFLDISRWKALLFLILYTGAALILTLCIPDFYCQANLVRLESFFPIILLLSVSLYPILIIGCMDFAIGAQFAFMTSLVFLLHSLNFSLFLKTSCFLLAMLIVIYLNTTLKSYRDLSPSLISFIMLGLLYGGSIALCSTNDILYSSSIFSCIGQPHAAICAIAVFALLAVAFIRHFTYFGNCIYVIGHAQSAIWESELNMKRFKFICYLISSLLIGLAALSLFIHTDTDTIPIPFGIELYAFFTLYMSAIFQNVFRPHSPLGHLFSFCLCTLLSALIATVCSCACYLIQDSLSSQLIVGSLLFLSSLLASRQFDYRQEIRILSRASGAYPYE